MLSTAVEHELREAKRDSDYSRWRVLLKRYGLWDRVEAGEALYPIPETVSLQSIPRSTPSLGLPDMTTCILFEFAVAFDAKTVGILKHVMDTDPGIKYKVYLQGEGRTLYLTAPRLDDLFRDLWMRLFLEPDLSRTKRWEFRRQGREPLVATTLNQKDVPSTWPLWDQWGMRAFPSK